MWNRSSKAQQGFTLIELLVVTTIMVVLTTVVIASFRLANQSARDSKRQADLEQVRGILENYRLENGAYPGSLSAETSQDGIFLQTVVGSDYMSRDYLDPMNTAEHFYFYQRHNQPGCTYELGAYLEGDTGKACPSSCGVSRPANYYCLTD